MSELCSGFAFASGERFEMVSEAVQDMVGGNVEVASCIRGLGVALADKYAAEGFDNERASTLVDRSVWNAVAAAKEHVVLSRTVRNWLPAYKSDEPVGIPDEMTRMSLFGSSPEVLELMTVLPMRKATQASLFELVLGRMESAALEELRSEGANDPESVYGQIDRAFQDTWAAYMASYNLAHQDEPIDYDGRTAEYTALLGNCYVPASLLIGVGLASTVGGGDGSPQGLARHAAMMTDKLAVAASFSRGTLPKIVPKLAAWYFGNHEKDRDQAAQLARIASRYTIDGIRHSAAARGMALNPHCAGLVACRPAKEDADDFGELFQIYRERYGHEMPVRSDGAFHKVAAVLGPISVQIARHTFYEHWQEIDPLRNKAF